jgi:zinc D-Ala-D-Ala carboxypeptidase
LFDAEPDLNLQENWRLVMGKVYKNWALYPTAEWRWPSFSPQEMASRCEGELMIDPTAMDRLQKLRTRLGKPLIINSAYRSEAHNRRVKGAKNSQHRLAKAFDVRMDNHNPHTFERAARECGFTGFGHYPKSGFMHIDIGPARRWNDGAWFPSDPGATPSFPAEPKAATLVSEVLKPEILTGAGTILTGATAVSQGNGPIQYAIAGVLVIAVIVLGGIVMRRVFGSRRD